jgi:hypothetical protein
VLDTEPDKSQMHFGIGVINLLIKGDINAAEAAFAKFRSADASGRHRQFHAWAEDQLARARSANI